MEEEKITEIRQQEINFGEMKTIVEIEGGPNTLNLIGFIPMEKSRIFTKMTPIKIINDTFLLQFSATMIRKNLDAVVHGEVDYIIRVFDLGENEVELLLCDFKPPLFKEGEVSGRMYLEGVKKIYM